eukprot:CAMPEP_0172324150 /NCGR_PEP_ID=MMETSP1058-20130122/50589_1 /TAXON_ID=83371 /ORGANISM="Detonula confervacea, Strain CCMP 353" /LENGTH=467 /DNA_ID=CAMNT_0013040347 /DNA_START=181 /DNA_END=1584 /DNA_ORIENTATION=+
MSRPPIISQSIHPCQPLNFFQPHPSHTTATRRLFSTTEKTTAQEPIANEEDNLFDPYDILRDLQNQTNKDELPKIPLPTHLSPTSLEQFHKCPQAFFFLYILKLTREPSMTTQLARGIICHTAIEEVFDLSPENRSLANLENLFRREWSRVRGDRGKNGDLNSTKKTRKEKEYDVLFREEGGEGTTASYDIDAEIEWGQSSLDLLRNYYELEDPRTVKNPNPLTREMWVQARFPTSDSNDDEFIVRGKIDRIDILQSTSSDDDKVQLQIIDYKTGKKPWLKYSQSVNDRIASENFWKMKVYALILWKMILQTDEASEQYRVQGQRQKEQYKYGMSWVLQQSLTQAMTHTQSISKWSEILQLNSLRLTHLTSNVDDESVNDSAAMSTDGKSNIGKATYLDYPLGSPSEFQSLLDQTELEVQTIARDIKILVDTQSPHAFKHCDWRYCSCHELRSKFRRGSVFQSPDLD